MTRLEEETEVLIKVVEEFITMLNTSGPSKSPLKLMFPIELKNKQSDVVFQLEQCKKALRGEECQECKM
jgi:hypothetical protein